MSKAEVCLTVVAKAPRPGSVKTRLCPPLTPEQAARIYTSCLLDTVELALQCQGCDVRVVCPTPEDARELGKILPPEVGFLLQNTSGLSAALAGSIRQGLIDGYNKVFCISSDNPTLPLSYLEEAFAALDRASLVLGPAEDGGYYLIGSTGFYPDLFEDITWSTSRVLAQTLEKARKAGLQTELLPAWYDLDTGSDLSKLLREFETNLGGARHTRPILLALASLLETELFG